MGRWVPALASICLLAAQGQEPRFTADSQLVRPEGYREWIFVGASLAMTYKQDGEAPGHPTFHNVYLNPPAYQEYKKTGKFPEGTILVMEVLTPASQVSINRQGQFEDRPLGIEAAVKDSSRFPETWAYFDFIQGGKKPFPGADTAKAFPKERCWACHVEHGQSDNVFTQFYPVLRRAAKAAAAK